MRRRGLFHKQLYIYIYRSKKVFFLFRSAIEYVGEIYYYPKTASELNIKGSMNLVKPVAEKLEQHGFEVTIWY